MDERQEMLELLRSIERTNRQKLTATVLMCIFMLISAAACVVICVLVGSLIPQVTEILGQVQGVLGNLEDVSNQLANLDLETAVSNMDTLTVYAQQSLQQTMDKLNTIDFEKLNKAIGDLAKVIEPMARFASMFG